MDPMTPLKTFALGLLLQQVALAAPAREDIVLPMGKVYHQVGLSSCWAYSTFHTLRTFYASQVSSPWKQAIEELDDSAAIREFLVADGSLKVKHNPLYFVMLLEKEWGLTDRPWKAYFTNPRCRKDLGPGGEEGSVATGDQIPDRIVASLRKGSPSVFCNRVHCVSLYGVTLENGAPKQYWVANSLGGLEKRAADAIPNSFCYLLTHD